MFKINTHAVNGIEIETHNQCPPVPVRCWDWAAWVKGACEETGPYAEGETEEEAIANLLECISDREA
jgi:hypothetical protein